MGTADAWDEGQRVHALCHDYPLHALTNLRRTCDDQKAWESEEIQWPRCLYLSVSSVASQYRSINPSIFILRDPMWEQLRIGYASKCAEFNVVFKSDGNMDL